MGYNTFSLYFRHFFLNSWETDGTCEDREWDDMQQRDTPPILSFLLFKNCAQTFMVSVWGANMDEGKARKNEEQWARFPICVKSGQMRRMNTIVKHNSYHYFSQPGAGNFAELSICFVVQDRPAVPNPKQTFHFYFCTMNPGHFYIWMAKVDHV